ncbi:MAG: phosphotransferase [Oscillospiraceae bacterium]|nr:phosphotransferase [Oscillospiraceae bacterium]
MLSGLLREHYGLDGKLTLLDSHFGTEIYRCGQHIVKTLPLSHAARMENEGHVTAYLRAQKIPVAEIMKTKQGMYHVGAGDISVHVQEYIEGETPQVNTAPDWMLEKMAGLLGGIHRVLDNYEPMSINFGKDFFRKASARSAKQNYAKQLREAKSGHDSVFISELEERVKHLGRIAAFDIDARKLTYRNSHGDFHVGQVIAEGENLTVIDWTSACRLPACLEVILSYVTADPACADGTIDAGRLKKYIGVYAKHAALTAYDLQMMPYVFYFQQILCHYPPPYSSVAETYQPICGLINRFTRWLYGHAEELSMELCKEALQ